MPEYFAITMRLRGCYLPEYATIVRVSTRRELKRALQWEADCQRDAGAIGLSKKAVARLAAESWRNAKRKRPSYLDNVAPYRFPSQGKGNYCMGLFCCLSDRAEYLAQ